LLSIAAIVLLSSSRGGGLRRVGIILIVVGIVMPLIGLVLSKGVKEISIGPQLSIKNAVLADAIHNSINGLSNNLSKIFYTIGSTYVVLGVLAIAGSMFVHRRGGRVPAELAHHEALNEGSEPAEPHHKKPTKIQ
jgi:hypothetical protein